MLAECVTAGGASYLSPLKLLQLGNNTELLHDNIKHLDSLHVIKCFILKHYNIHPLYESQLQPVTPSSPLSRRHGCGNNAYWVTNQFIYEPPKKCPTIPPVRPPCTSAGNSLHHAGNMYDSRTLRCLNPPTPLWLVDSRMCCCYSASRVPLSGRHSASVFVLWLFLSDWCAAAAFVRKSMFKL